MNGRQETLWWGDRREIELLAILYIYQHKDEDIGGVVIGFAHLKGTHLALCL